MVCGGGTYCVEWKLFLGAIAKAKGQYRGGDDDVNLDHALILRDGARKSRPKV